MVALVSNVDAILETALLVMVVAVNSRVNDMQEEEKSDVDGKGHC